MLDPNLDPAESMAMLVAMHVRNELERFHADDETDKIEGLDDAAMAKVNPVIRRAIYEVMWSIEHPESLQGRALLHFLAACIPSEWEPPSELPPTDALELDDQTAARMIRFHGGNDLGARD